jgi:uncharacterized protein
MKKYFLYFLLLVFCACSTTTEHNTHTTLYGSFSDEDPLIKELLQHPAMLRLQNVQQYGTAYFYNEDTNYSRYDHSVGVFALLKRYGASYEEQVAGLLHDASHTVFSHVGDYLFDTGNEESYQDNIHLWHLKRSGIAEILESYDFPLETASPDLPQYSSLECDLPDMCADRIEYNLQGGLIDHLITKKEFDEILSDLHLENQLWFFTKPAIARKFAALSLHMTRYQWGAAWNLSVYHATANLLKLAVKKNIVTMEEIHFSNDKIVWERLSNSEDPEIQQIVDQVVNCKKYFKLTKKDNYDICMKGKFRGIDPRIKTPQGFQRLSEVDNDFREVYEATQRIMAVGWKLRKTYS